MGFVTNVFYMLQKYHVIEISSTAEMSLYLEEPDIAFIIFLLPLEVRRQCISYFNFFFLNKRKTYPWENLMY